MVEDNNLSYYFCNFCRSTDVFHKECLNDWASRMAPNTAPAGYKCPVCSSPVFPAPNLVSPVADRLRQIISIYPWAQTGLGLPLVSIFYFLFFFNFNFLFFLCVYLLYSFILTVFLLSSFSLFTSFFFTFIFHYSIFLLLLSKSCENRSTVSEC